VPAAQRTQLAAPAPEEEPAAQAWHTLEEVAPTTGEKVPAGHKEGATPPPGQYEPAGQTAVALVLAAGQ